MKTKIKSRRTSDRMHTTRPNYITVTQQKHIPKQSYNHFIAERMQTENEYKINNFHQMNRTKKEKRITNMIDRVRPEHFRSVDQARILRVNKVALRQRRIGFAYGYTRVVVGRIDCVMDGSLPGPTPSA